MQAIVRLSCSYSIIALIKNSRSTPTYQMDGEIYTTTKKNSRTYQIRSCVKLLDLIGNYHARIQKILSEGVLFWQRFIFFSWWVVGGSK